MTEETTEQPEDGIIVKEDVDLREIFSESVEDETPESTPEDKKPDKVTPSSAPTGISVEMVGALDSLKSELYELRAQNTLLRGEIDQVRTSHTSPPVKDEVDMEEFNLSLRSDPGKAIKDLIEKTINSGISSVRQETTKVVDERGRMAEMHRQDQTKTLAEYGELMQNPDFKQTAAMLYDQITGDKDWVPNAMYLAASTAYAKLVKSGKLSVGPDPAKLRLIPRPQNPVPAFLGESSTVAESEGDGEFSAIELRAIDKVCKEWDITRVQYMKQFSTQRRKDGTFGRRH